MRIKQLLFDLVFRQYYLHSSVPMRQKPGPLRSEALSTLVAARAGTPRPCRRFSMRMFSE